MKKITILTGAGISAESGISTFRDSNGLWEGHDVTEVASPQGWNKNKELVLDFYNKRRAQLYNVEPNSAHLGLKQLEKTYEVKIITQNVDDLHERAGSSSILHLHGELKKSRSTLDPTLIYNLNNEHINIGDKCEKGSQLRPHIVWFGEAVPAIEEAITIAKQSDIFIIIGTSLLVYPAASLYQYIKPDIPIYLIDPNLDDLPKVSNPLIHYKEKASKGVELLLKQLSLK